MQHGVADLDIRGADSDRKVSYPMRFGVQFYPLPAAPATAVFAGRAMSQRFFERLWVADDLNS